MRGKGKKTTYAPLLFPGASLLVLRRRRKKEREDLIRNQSYLVALLGNNHRQGLLRFSTATDLEAILSIPRICTVGSFAGSHWPGPSTDERSSTGRSSSGGGAFLRFPPARSSRPAFVGKACCLPPSRIRIQDGPLGVRHSSMPLLRPLFRVPLNLDFWWVVSNCPVCVVWGVGRSTRLTSFRFGF